MKNKGFTLIETIIAIGLFGILVTIAIGAFVNVLHTQRELGSLISVQSNTSLALEQMTREIRTGYLFCHALDTTGSGPVTTPDLDCGCTQTGLLNGNPGDPIWSCSALDFINSNSENVVYSLATGTLMRKDNFQNNDVPSPITGSDVSVKNLTFILRGQIEGDHWNPLITVLLAAAASSTDPAIASDTLHFQTSVSARLIDCDPHLPTSTQC